MRIRPTFTDVIVILIVVLSLASFTSKYIPHITPPKYQFEFSGSQIYSAVAFCENLESKGFLYTVLVKGFFVSDYEPFEKEGFLKETGRGNFTFKMPDGQTYSVGGRGSYLEDVQAERIVVYQKSKSTVIFSMMDFRAKNSEEALGLINDASSFIDYEKEDLAISARISIDAHLVPSASEEAFIESLLEKNVYRMKRVEIRMEEDGFFIDVEKVSMEGLPKIFSLLSGYGIGDAFFSDVKVFYQTSEEIKPEDIDALETFKHPAIVSGSIHVRV